MGMPGLHSRQRGPLGSLPGVQDTEAMRSEVLVALLWTVACSLLFFWFFSMAVHGAMQTPASYVQNPAKCQVPRGPVLRYP